MSVAVGAKYTKENIIYNGLDAVEKALVEEALNGEVRTRYAVVRFEVTNLDIDVASGKRQPRVNLSAIEVMHGDDADTVKGMLGKEFRYRSGRIDEPTGDTIFDTAQPALEAAPKEDAKPGEPWPGDVNYSDGTNGDEGSSQPDSGPVTDDAPNGGDPAGDGQPADDKPSAKRSRAAKAAASA